LADAGFPSGCAGLCVCADGCWFCSGRLAWAGGGHGGMPLQAQFSAAATEFGVPTAVLLAVGYEESRWEMHSNLPSVAGGFGAMHLTDTAVVGRGDGQFDGDARGAAEAPAQSELLDTGGPPPREHDSRLSYLVATARYPRSRLIACSTVLRAL